MREGWEERTLAEVCEMYQPKTITAKDMLENGPYPVYGANGLVGYYDKYNHEEPQLLITCRGATCGTVNISKPMSWITGNSMVIKPRIRTLDVRFLEYFFRDGANITVAITGAAQPQITRTNLNPIKIKYPPLPEQHRIVAILDEAFEGIAIAKANAEKNLQNAREVFESHLNAVFLQRGEGWETTTLGDAYDVRDGTHDSPKYVQHGYALITSKNLKRDGLDLDNVKFISGSDFKKINERSAVHKGDVLLAMIGTIGSPTIIDIEPNFAIKNVALFKMKDNKNGKFLCYYFSSQSVVKKMQSEAKGTTQKFVGLGYLRNFSIHLPPPNQEPKIIAALDALLSETQRLESIYQQKLTALDELKQSLLHQAFNGDL